MDDDLPRFQRSNRTVRRQLWLYRILKEALQPPQHIRLSDEPRQHATRAAEYRAHYRRVTKPGGAH
jgi:hypothetical protein